MVRPSPNTLVPWSRSFLTVPSGAIVLRPECPPIAPVLSNSLPSRHSSPWVKPISLRTILPVTSKRSGAGAVGGVSARRDQRENKAANGAEESGHAVTLYRPVALRHRERAVVDAGKHFCRIARHHDIEHGRARGVV